MTSIRSLVVLCSASLAGLGAWHDATAQSASDNKRTAEPKELEEIVVTAQKRSEDVQDVPITIAVVTDEQLAQQNIVTSSDLVRAVPSLTVTNFGVFQIRSLGTQGFGRSGEQSVSVVVDGVPMPRPQAYELANGLFDVNHVEVLSGPQGTLFGRNATAGVINVVSNAPVLQKFEGGVHLDVGEKNVLNAQGFINLPMGDTTALRLVAHHNAYGGLVYNTIFKKWDDFKDDGLRARLLWEPSDALRINVIGDYQKIDSNGVNGMADFAGVAVFTEADPASPLGLLLADCGVKPGPNNDRVCGDTLYDPTVKNHGDVYGAERLGGSVQVDWEFGDGYTFTSISGLRHDVTGDFGVEGNFAGSYGDTTTENFLQRNIIPSSIHYFSQELRLTSPAEDRVNYVAGLYYSRNARQDHVDQSGGFNVLGPSYPLTDLGYLQFRRVNDSEETAQNYGIFGQVNFEVTDKLRLIGGARATRDKLEVLVNNSFPDALPAGPFIYTGNKGFFSLYPINTCTMAGGDPDDPSTCPSGTSMNAPAKLSETGYTWKVGAQYKFNDVTMAYATYTKGYKGPFINDQASSVGGAIMPRDLLIVDSEKPDSYEIGLKTTLMDRLNVSVALFDTKAHDFQTTIYVPSEVSGLATPSFIQGNSDYAHSKGVDFGVVGSIGENFSFNGSLLYNKAEFNDGFLVPCTSDPSGTCEARRQMPYAPVWKATASAEYRHALGGWGEGFVAGDVTYTSGYPYGSSPSPDSQETSDRTLLGARAGLRFADDKYGVSVYCRNCTDERYPIMSQNGNSGSGGQVSFFNLSSFRIFGISFDGKF